MRVTQAFTFEAAHYLPKVPPGHKCKNMHGHSYRIEVSFFGGVQYDGFVIDFFDVEKIMKPLIEAVDHKILNDIKGLENPTAENIALWFADKIVLDKTPSVALGNVRVYETPMCWAEC